MLELVMVVYFTEVKKSNTAVVFRIPRQITNFLRTGTKDAPVFLSIPQAKNMPIKNLKKVISMAGISELLVISFAKTVAEAKQNSPAINKNTPFRILKLNECKNSIYPPGYHE